MRQLLLRIPPVNRNVDCVKTALEEMLIGLDMKRRRHGACGVGQHAVLGNNRIGLDVN